MAFDPPGAEETAGGSMRVWLSAASGEATGSRSTFSGGCGSGARAWAMAAESQPQPRQKISAAAIGTKRSLLLQRSIVSGTSMNGQRRQPRWSNQLYFQFTPLPVTLLIRRPVTEDIFIAKLGADLGGDVRHVGDVVDAEKPAAGFIADVVEQQRPQPLLGGRRILVEDADRVNLHVRFAHRRPHF